MAIPVTARGPPCKGLTQVSEEQLPPLGPSASPGWSLGPRPLMSILLTLCAVLLPLVTPGRGGRRWEPCTGKGAAALGAGRVLLGTECHFLRRFRVPGALGQVEVGRAEVEKMKGSREAITIETRPLTANRVGTLFKALGSRHRRPFTCIYLLALLGAGLPPASGMKLSREAEDPGGRSAKRRAAPQPGSSVP